MKINIKVTEKDYIKFNEFYLKNSEQGKKTTLLLRIIMPSLFLVILLLCLIANADKVLLIIEAVVFSVASVIWVIMVPGLMNKNIRRDINTIKKDGKLPYHNTSEIEFSETEIIETTPDSTLKIKYRNVLSVNSTEEYIYIFFGGAQAFIIPRRCIDSEFDLENFLKEHIH